MDALNLLISKEYRNNLIIKTFTEDKSFDKELVYLLINKINKKTLKTVRKKLKIN